jgi:RNA polymerase primary sigma factor
MRPDLDRYAAAIRAHPPLRRDEERALALRARGGDRSAAQKLVRHNLAFVVSIAAKQKLGTVSIHDVIQEGSLGLIRALDKFDPDSGNRFCTYAVWWIRAYIGKYLKQARSSVRPRSGTVALEDLSLDVPVSEDTDVTFGDQVEDERPGAEHQLVEAEGDRLVRSALARVRKRVGELGWDVIHGRLATDDPATLDEIAGRHGLSRERVRQVELKTTKFLRGYLTREVVMDEKNIGASSDAALLAGLAACGDKAAADRVNPEKVSTEHEEDRPPRADGMCSYCTTTSLSPKNRIGICSSCRDSNPAARRQALRAYTQGRRETVPSRRRASPTPALAPVEARDALARALRDVFAAPGDLNALSVQELVQVRNALRGKLDTIQAELAARAARLEEERKAVLAALGEAA